MIDVTIDFETYYGTNYSLTKLSTPEYVYHDSFYVHMMGIKINNEPTAIIDPENIQATFDWLKTQEVNLIAHNCLFDGYIASQIYGYIPQRYTDTAAMARGDNAHASASLKNTCKRLWPNDPTKRKGEELARSFNIKNLNTVDGLFSAISGYCSDDTDLCYWVYKRLQPKIPSDEMDMISILTSMFCDPILEADTDLLERYLRLLESRRSEVIASSGTTEEVLRSDAKYTALIKSLGVEPPTKISPATGMHAPAFAKNDLAYQKLQRDLPEYQHIWDARQAAKSSIDITRTSRFLTVGKLAKQMPVMLKYSAAHTHRLGGGDKMNMQNLPRNAWSGHEDGDLRPGVLRRCLCAPEGYSVLVRDLSQIEARILAVIADQIDLVEVFATGGDPYSYMASRIYGREISKENDPFERNVGKVSVLGLGYGMSGGKFKDTLNSGPMGMAPIFFDDASMYDRIVYTIYRGTNRGITNFWKTCDRFIHWMITGDDSDGPLVYKCLKVWRGRIELPNGLFLNYPNIRYDKHGSAVYDGKSPAVSIYGGKLTENIVQALAQIVIKAIMLSASRTLTDWRVALQVHDEVILVGPEKQVEDADKKLAQIMSTPPSWMPELPLDSEGGWARNYSK